MSPVAAIGGAGTPVGGNTHVCASGATVVGEGVSEDAMTGKS
jgi:hypothetical protein